MVTVALDRDKRDENASVSVKRGRVTPPGGHERLSIMEGQAWHTTSETLPGTVIMRSVLLGAAPTP